MADIMMMASPAPPASCMALRQKRIMGPALVTSTTERPVVVHPLTASKTDLEKGSCKTAMKGHAEKTMTTIQLMRTITPPSWIERVTLGSEAKKPPQQKPCKAEATRRNGKR